jgi:hypothetical protein
MQVLLCYIIRYLYVHIVVLVLDAYVLGLHLDPMSE